jgi:hypothetical protein
MDFYKKILIFLIIIISTFVIWRLIMKQQELYYLINTNQIQGFQNQDFDTTTNVQPINNKREGATNIDDSEVASVSSSLPINIVSVSRSTFKDQPLLQFSMKASYNTAITGNYASTEMVKYVLSRGCRWIDFEIFLIDGKPKVSYSTDPKYNILSTTNHILLDVIFETIINNAFNANNTPNHEDPLFIHLRIKSNYTSVYKKVASSIKSVLKNALYDGKVSPKETKISDIMNKIVIVMDRTIVSKYSDYTECTEKESSSDIECVDLTKFIHMESGTSKLIQQTQNQLLNSSGIEIHATYDICPICTDVQQMRVVLPDITNTGNPDMKDFIKDYGCQILPFQFYFNDGSLKKYETFFNENKFAFVPISTGQTYFLTDH